MESKEVMSEVERLEEQIDDLFVGLAVLLFRLEFSAIPAGIKLNGKIFLSLGWKMKDWDLIYCGLWCFWINFLSWLFGKEWTAKKFSYIYKDTQDSLKNMGLSLPELVERYLTEYIRLQDDLIEYSDTVISPLNRDLRGNLYMSWINIMNKYTDLRKYYENLSERINNITDELREEI